MNNDSSCNLVKDLLPIYLDGIASEESIVYVEKHLKGCQLCLKEYEKLHELQKNQEKIILADAWEIRNLKKNITFLFSSVIIVSILLIGIAVFCHYKRSYNPPRFFDFLSLTILYIGIFFLPLLGILVSHIWKKILTKTASTFWPNVFIAFLSICFLVAVSSLLINFYTVIKTYYG